MERDGDLVTVKFSMAVRVVGQGEEVPRDDYLRTRRIDGEWKIVAD